MKRLIYADSTPNSNMTIDEFISQVKEIYSKYFPNSECYARNLKTLGMEYIRIGWFLSADASECPHNIRTNDLLHVDFTIDLEDNTESGKLYEMWTYDNSHKNIGYMPSTITLEINDKIMFCKADRRNMAYSYINFPFRKTTGTPEKILATLDKYANVVYTTVSTCLADGKIPDDRVEFVRSKI